MQKFIPLSDETLVEMRQRFELVVVPVMAAKHEAENNPRPRAVLDWRTSNNEQSLYVEGGPGGRETFTDYYVNAADKCNAINEHPEIELSWEVHKGDITQKPYPGGLRTPWGDIGAISGFSWELDTIGMLHLSRAAGRMGVQKALQLADRCGIRSLFIEMNVKLLEAERAAGINLAA